MGEGVCGITGLVPHWWLGYHYTWITRRIIQEVTLKTAVLHRVVWWAWELRVRLTKTLNNSHSSFWVWEKGSNPATSSETVLCLEVKHAVTKQRRPFWLQTNLSGGVKCLQCHRYDSCKAETKAAPSGALGNRCSVCHWVLCVCMCVFAKTNVRKCGWTREVREATLTIPPAGL